MEYKCCQCKGPLLVGRSIPVNEEKGESVHPCVDCQIKNMDKKIKILEADNADLLQTAQQWESSFRDASAAADNIQKDLFKTRDLNDELEKENTDLQDKIRKIEQKHRDQTDYCRLLHKEKDRLEDDLARANIDIRQHEIALKKQIDKNNGKPPLRDGVSPELWCKSYDERESLKKQLAEKETELGQKEAEIETLRDLLSESERENAKSIKGGVDLMFGLVSISELAGRIIRIVMRTIEKRKGEICGEGENSDAGDESAADAGEGGGDPGPGGEVEKGKGGAPSGTPRPRPRLINIQLVPFVHRQAGEGAPGQE